MKIFDGKIIIISFKKDQQIRRITIFLKHYLTMNEPKVGLFTIAEDILKDSKILIYDFFTVEASDLKIEGNSK